MKNVEMTKILMEYAEENKDELNLYENDMDNISEIPNEIIELFVRYEKIVDINYKTSKEDSEFEKKKCKLIKIEFKKSLENDVIEKFKFIIEKAKQKEILLNLNIKNKDGNDPFLWACDKSDISTITLLIE